MRFDLTTLRLFLAVVDRGSITKAAEQEHIVASAVSKRLSDLEIQLGSEAFQLRGQAGGDALFRPEQLFPEGGEGGAAAPLESDQRTAEERGPAPDQVPGVAVGQADFFCGQGQLAGVVDGLQHREQLLVQFVACFVAHQPGRPDDNFAH